MSINTIKDPQWQEIIRYVGKHGEFSFVHDKFDRITSTLSDEQVVAFYQAILEGSGRHEEEWRDEFLSLFPAAEVLIPDPLTY
ncbi:hypothetical protein [Brevundimonas sp.]|jgi:hypothetical protein|uniref:hypothetical protein n=1 Tax=Brevundimonas sp. TaxID=1871086 RepID=UPI002E1104F5|nr:hypothetical protein [Brevundimonas sp.]